MFLSQTILKNTHEVGSPRKPRLQHQGNWDCNTKETEIASKVGSWIDKPCFHSCDPLWASSSRTVPCRYKTLASPSVCDSRCPVSLRMVQPLSAIAVNWWYALLSMDNSFIDARAIAQVISGQNLGIVQISWTCIPICSGGIIPYLAEGRKEGIELCQCLSLSLWLCMCPVNAYTFV